MRRRERTHRSQQLDDVLKHVPGVYAYQHADSCPASAFACGRARYLYRKEQNYVWGNERALDPVTGVFTL
eukprot:6171869-Pleurochrysis_carterae.AAC.1